MMFGTGDIFNYFECSKCGSLQIAKLPKHPGKFYSTHYRSHSVSYPRNSIRAFLKKRRDKLILYKKGPISTLLNKWFPNNILIAIDRLAVFGVKIDISSKILDVGCGSGTLLYLLKNLGFKNLLGVDPYLEEGLGDEVIQFSKKSLLDIDLREKYDLIIFNHSFEHILEQLKTLVKATRFLGKNGFCIIRMPVKTHHIWNLYGTDWIQIDAPRHYIIHTIESFNHLINQTNLCIKETVFDSTEFQFWASEQCKNNIPLKSERSYSVNPRKSTFAANQIRNFRKASKELNRNKQGDQATFYLRNEGKS